MAAEHSWEQPADEAYWRSVMGQPGESTPTRPADDTTSVGWARAEQSYVQGDVLELRVVGYNRGGVLVDLGDTRGFVPASQLASFPRQVSEEERVQALARYSDTTLKLKVIEFDRAHNRLILSERVVNPAPSRAEQMLASIQPNETRHGVVRNVTSFGAFIDLGGVEGLIHVSELSWQFVQHPRDVLTPGQQVDVLVLEVNREQKRIACSLKRLQQNPWEQAARTLKPGDWVSGVVTSVVAFGAFVRVADGVEGLLHISELATGDLAHPRDVLQEGQAVQARVLEIEPTQQKMKLTLRRNNTGEMSADVVVPEQAAPRRIPPPPPVDDAYWESLIQSE